ncbi:MAG TPA: hypothetical protein VMZ49_04080 [Patescibacteria group bacterium]|nr:hypothetical protein [Patescibacteria group bacterium]
MIESKNLELIFTALDRQISVSSGARISLVVCGGTALAALQLVARTTKDVDVLGSFKKGQIVKIGVFPEWLKAAAAKVERDFNLPADWLNLGPESQLDTGLPKGLLKRLVKKVYGNFLTIFFISRIDQIHFKLYASLDRGGYHVEDLFKLNPSEVELLAASRWVLTQDVSVGFRMILISFLKKHGYEKLAGKI